MRHIFAAIVVVLVVVTSGCGGSSTAAPAAATVAPETTQTPTPMEETEEPVEAREMEDLADLLSDMMLAGYPCERENFELSSVKYASESGACSGHDVFSVYSTERQLERQEDAHADFEVEYGIDHEKWLYGPNWIINARKKDMRSLQEQMGGEIR